MNNYDLLLQCLDIILESRLWKDKKPSEVFKILVYVHQKGWLYTPRVGDKIKAVMCGYRISDGDSLIKLPTEDKGNILYIPFVISLDKEADLFHIVRESCKIYLSENPDINEIILEDKNNNIRRYPIKGVKNGKESTVTTPNTANV